MSTRRKTSLKSDAPVRVRSQFAATGQGASPPTMSIRRNTSLKLVAPSAVRSHDDGGTGPRTGNETLPGVNGLNSPMVPVLLPGGTLAVNQKLYMLPQRIALPLGLRSEEHTSELQSLRH